MLAENDVVPEWKSRPQTSVLRARLPAMVGEERADALAISRDAEQIVAVGETLTRGRAIAKIADASSILATACDAATVTNQRKRWCKC
jgi:hypothetical protein